MSDKTTNQGSDHIKILVSKIENDTSCPIYLVEVETAKTLWPEHFPTQERVRAFIRGVKAGVSAMGNFDVREEWSGEGL